MTTAIDSTRSSARTFSSSASHNWLTWPAETPAMPSSPSTASILRVLTPRTTASWITLTSACPLRFRCSMKLGT
jgi:hypothetical protein